MERRKLQTISTFFEDQIGEVLHIIEVVLWAVIPITIQGYPMVK
jgi:hypothetical protein